MLIRQVGIEDIPALAILHVQVWKETYCTTISPPNYRIHEYQWQPQFKITGGSWFCLVIENKNGQLIGFAKGKKYSHRYLPEFSGELNKIYLLQEYQRRGLGRKLVGQVARRFLSLGFQIWYSLAWRKPILQIS